jgi:hypothetical protein
VRQAHGQSAAHFPNDRTCQRYKLWLQLYCFAVHWAANGIAQDQDVLARGFTLQTTAANRTADVTAC